MKTNKDMLPIKSLIGEVVPISTMEFGFMVMDSNGKGHYRTGTGGISYNCRLGDRCSDIVGEHVQAGICTRFSGNSGPASGPMGSPLAIAYNIYACAGNEVTIAPGSPLAGAKGFVTGKITGFGVTVDFDKDIIDELHGDERFYIKACGVGLSLSGIDDNIMIHNISPFLFEKLGITEDHGCFSIPVTKVIPGFLVGPGVGGGVIAGSAQIMTDHGTIDKEYGLNELCLGDIIAITDLDTTSGRCVLNGAVSICIVVSSDSIGLGSGPCIMTILASKTSIIKPVISSDANIKNYLKIE